MDPEEKSDSATLDTCERCGHKFKLSTVGEQDQCQCHDHETEAGITENYLALSPEINYTNYLPNAPTHKEPNSSQPHLLVSDDIVTTASYQMTLAEPDGRGADWQIPWYEIVEQLEDGTFCHVLKAKRQGFDKFFIVKVLKAQFAKNPRMSKRFELEARKVADMDHSNLAAVYDAGKTSQDLPYFVSDFIEGDALSSVIAKRLFFPEEEAVEIFLQICDALIYAHSKKCIHRSLKPGNIFLTQTPDGRTAVKVTDAGIARVIPVPENDKVYTAAEQVFGDARYMSPEQCRRERLDERSDVYSLGCLMYQMLGGKTPFDGAKAAEIRLKQIENEPVALSKRFPDRNFTPKLEKTVMHALTRDAALRYQSIADLKHDLLAVRESWKEPGNMPRFVSPVLADYQANNKKLRWLLLLVAAVTLFGMLMPHLFLPPNGANSPLNIPTELNTFHAPLVAAPQVVPRTDHRVLYYIKNIHNASLYSGIGPSLGKVLEQAVKEGVNLTGANLTGESLSNLDLHGAKLRDAQFYTAKLDHTNFEGADLRGAQFSDVAMTDANLNKAQLQNAIITDSDLTSSQLNGANLKKSFLRDCELNATKLKAANFRGASVYQCQFPEEAVKDSKELVEHDRYPASVQKFAIVSSDGKVLFKAAGYATFKATIEKAVRDGVSLRSADLRGADLNGAKLAGADLRLADLRGALLTGADLSNTNLEFARGQGAELGISLDDLAATGLRGWEAFKQPEPTPQPNAIERVDEPAAATAEKSAEAEQ